MKRILIAMLLVGICSAAQGSPKYVLPTRTDLGIMIPTHSLPSATYTNTTTWLTGQGTETNLYDFSPEHDDPVYVDNPCLTFDGTDYISIPGLSEYAPVVNSGTATLEVPRVANELHFTAGTCWDVKVFDSLYFPCQERFGTDIYNVAGTQTATLVTTDLEAIRTDNTQNDSSYFAEHGGSKVTSFNGVDAYATTEYVPTTNSINIKCKMRFKDELGVQTIGVTDLNMPPTKFYFGINNGSWFAAKGGLNPDAGEADTDWHLFEYDYLSGLKVDGTLVVNLSGVNGDMANNANPIYLGALNNSGSIIWNVNCEIEYYDVYDSTTLIHSWRSANAYGTTIPDSVGVTGATLVNTEFVYIPALADGTDDAEGLGITNPGGVVHNGGPYSISNSVMGAVTYADLITNAVYNVTTNASGAVMEVYIEN